MCAARDADLDGDAVRRWLDRHGASAARRFAAHDADDLNEEIVRGKITAVLFPDEAALLQLIFDGRVSVRVWLERGVSIEFARPDDATSDSREWLRRVDAAYGDWRAAQHRRRALAGFGLALLGLLAATIVIVLPRWL